ncbi:ATP-binding cassette protein subfamily B, member 2, putative [Leishmania donovani]|uniref:ABC transporter transmembrane region family protein n=1 Tax=Leishmania donovani TaxID=5661 RepID=A0A3Q8ICF5_LEIDO|nr:ATP-binding cassette protein subfamily B, member 2, putative [Leishmania donovani]AYU79874.1 ATP-binding cassette protein subfamily B, member 2, putative [Leishmania donovani]TPP41293.1 ABC transporter transmembrane region family protein [Leishmania donovani]CBZ35157.1 ATP-binding cassette protein subfamily B, member 2, putative [Leishmania donovani]
MSADKKAKAKQAIQDAKAAVSEKLRGQVPILTLLRYRASSEWFAVVVGSIAAFCAGGSTPLFMYFFGRMTNSAYDDEAAPEVTRSFAMLMVCIGILSMVLVFIKTATYQVTATRLVGRIKCAYFSAVVNQDIGWHDKRKPGELISRLTGDTRVILNGVNDRFASWIENLGTGLIGIVFAFIASWELTLLIMGSLPLIAVAVYFLTAASSRHVAVTRKQYAVASAIAQEVMQNIKTVQSFNREMHEAERFSETIVGSRKAGIKKEFLVAMAGGSVMGIMLCVIGLAFILAAYLVHSGRTDVGSVSAAFLTVMYGAMGLGQVFPALISFVEARTAAYPIFATIDEQPTIDLHGPGREATFCRCIEVKDVTFAYPTRPDQLIFSGLSATIRKGEKVAFSGSTGCGKSTIISLIQRFYDPMEGAVTVDGQDLRDLDLRSWRKRIGIVSQEPNLFSGSVLDNVRMGRRSATLEEVVTACKQARIHDTILALPRGYDTSVGSLGSQLSGGQKQRLAIARAVVRGADILLLDEATSALDRKSEVEVQRAIDDLTEHSKMTVITIAHRMATISNMDCIYFLDGSRDGGSCIVECGTYDELIRMNGRFASMVMMQNPSTGNLRTVVHDTSFYLYPGALDKITGGSVSTEDSYSSNDSWDSNCNGFYEDDDRWSQYSHVDDVPFIHRTDWEERKTSVSMWRIMKMTKSRWWAIALGFLGSIITAIVFPCVSLMITQLINTLGTYRLSQDTTHMQRQIALYVILLILLGAVYFLGSVLTGFYGYVGEYLTCELRTILFQQILRQDQTFFDMPRRDPGALAALLSGDCESVHQLYGPTLGSRLRSVCAFAGGIAIGLTMEWKVALVCLATMPLFVGSIIAQQVFFADSQSVRESGIDTVVSEALGSIRTVTSFNMQDRMIKEYKRTINVAEQTAERRAVLVSILAGATEITLMGSMALSFWYGGTLIERGETHFSNVLVAAMAVTMGSTLAGAEAGSFATKLRDARLSSNRVFSVIDRVPAVDSYEYGKVNFEEQIGVEFHHVGFTYPAREGVKVLNDVSLKFQAGSSNGLMGQTGCGKSTIVQILARFYPISTGKVLINGEDLSSLDLVTWRDQLSIVLQEPSLFSGTIRDNIKYSLPDATEEEVIEAAKIACIHDDIMNMEKGYDTEVGYRGQQLSGGQKQRVAIARGVLRCPKLLLLDEATSALDNITEVRVQRNLDEFQRRFGVTTVAIAHRLATIRHSNQIVLLDSGKIIEQGTHEQLLAQDGEYKSRWELAHT